MTSSAALKEFALQAVAQRGAVTGESRWAKTLINQPIIRRN
jgi:hypothetical protein